MISEFLQEAEQKFQKAVLYLESELAGIHTGRANSALVENIEVEAYGIKNSVKGIATISIPDATSIVIQPWDKNLLSEIEAAIRKSEFNVNPINNGENIRINMPSLNEERRKEFVKIIQQKGEEERISLRTIRHEALEEIKKAKENKEISEDEMFRFKEELDKSIENYNQKISKILESKEKELLTI